MLFSALFSGALGTQVIQAELTEIPNPLRDVTINLANIFEGKSDAAPFAEQLLNKWTYFCANISLGTPAQQFYVQLDTGSSDLWVPAKLIKPDGFDPSKSDSFNFLTRDFYVRYIKDFAQGYWGMDTLTLAGSGVTIKNQKFGVATNIPESTIGILGLGPGQANKTNHFLSALVKQGIIARNAYSVFLGNERTDTGTILFGGVDKGKYDYLSTLPLKSNTSFTVEMQGVHYGNKSHGPLDVVLDTGTSLSYLPSELVADIASNLSCTLNPSLGMYICPTRDLKPNVSFVFGNSTIEVSEKDLFWPLSYFTLSVSPYRVLTLVSNSQSMGINVLGSSFLRNAYVLFEPDRQQVQIGKYSHHNHTQIVTI